MIAQPSILDSAPETPAVFPAWFAELQQQAWQTFQEADLPSRKNENWRFGNLKQLSFDQFTVEESSDVSYKIPTLPAGVICLPFEQALQQHGDLVKQHFMQKEARLGSAKFVALHKSQTKTGLFVYVPDGVVVEKTVEVTHVLKGSNATSFPHTLIITGKNAEVSVVEKFTSADKNDAGLCIAVNDLIAGAGSNLKYVAIQELNLSSKMIQANNTHVERSANVTAFTLNTGAEWARNESLNTLAAEGANSDMLSCSIASGSQQYDQRTFQEHAAPHTTSNLLYKNTLYGTAKTVFAGLIKVDDGAHYTDAYQTCRNLLMEDTTEASSMPGLEINADQVKCSHGSTAASISDDEIFYLRARGIHPVTARRLIAHGFSIEVIELLKSERLEEMVIEAVDTKFAAIR